MHLKYANIIDGEKTYALATCATTTTPTDNIPTALATALATCDVFICRLFFDVLNSNDKTERKPKKQMEI